MKYQKDLFSGFLDGGSSKRTRRASGDISIGINGDSTSYISFRQHFKEAFGEELKAAAFKFNKDSIIMLLNPPDELKVPVFSIGKNRVIRNKILTSSFVEHYNLSTGDSLLLKAEEIVDTILGVKIFILKKIDNE